MYIYIYTFIHNVYIYIYIHTRRFYNLLNTCRNGNLTISLGSLFQSLTALSVKKFFIISNLNLTWWNVRQFALILSLVIWERRPTHTVLWPPFRQLQRVIRSLLSLIFSRLNNPSCLLAWTCAGFWRDRLPDGCCLQACSVIYYIWGRRWWKEWQFSSWGR